MVKSISRCIESSSSAAIISSTDAVAIAASPSSSSGGFSSSMISISLVKAGEVNSESSGLSEIIPTAEMGLFSLVAGAFDGEHPRTCPFEPRTASISGGHVGLESVFGIGGRFPVPSAPSPSS